MTEERAVCPSCGAVNRLPPDRPAGMSTCGRCKSALFGVSPPSVSAAVFDRHVHKGTLPVVVDVWAPWCGPCRTMAPEFAKAAGAVEPSVRFLKLNSDDQPELAGRLGIRSIPTMILFKDGLEVARTSGAMPAAQIVEWVRQRMA